MTWQDLAGREGKCANCPGRQMGFCARLPARLRARLYGEARSHDFAADHHFWGEDGPPGFVGILSRGYLRMQRHSIDGRRQIMALVFPGELFGENAEPGSAYGLESATPVTLCRLERSTFERLLDEEPELRREVYRAFDQRLEKLRWLTWTLGMQTPEERLCAFLFEACSFMPFEPLPDGGGVLSMMIPRGDIADSLNITRETISRLTHRLEDLGVIEIRGPKHFVIRDPERLAEIGGLSPTGRAA